MDVKKDLEDKAHELRELDKDMQANFSGPLVSDAAGCPEDAGLGSEPAGRVLSELRGLHL